MGYVWSLYGVCMVVIWCINGRYTVYGTSVVDEWWLYGVGIMAVMMVAVWCFWGSFMYGDYMVEVW